MTDKDTGGTVTDLQVQVGYGRGYLIIRLSKPDETWAEARLPWAEVRKLTLSLIAHAVRRRFR